MKAVDDPFRTAAPEPPAAEAGDCPCCDDGQLLRKVIVDGAPTFEQCNRCGYSIGRTKAEQESKLIAEIANWLAEEGYPWTANKLRDGSWRR